MLLKMKEIKRKLIYNINFKYKLKLINFKLIFYFMKKILT